MKTGWQTPWVRAVTTLLTVVVMVMIFCFSMETADDSDKRSGVISEVFIRIFFPGYEQMDPARQQAVYDNVQHIVRKLAHFTEYLMLGFMIRLCLESWFGRRKILFPCAWAAGTVYAGTDELHQMLVDGRNGQWADVLLDSSGIMTGVLIAGLILFATWKKRHRA